MSGTAATSATMLAAVQDRYGSPDVLELRQVPRPTVGRTARCSCGCMPHP